MMVWWFRKLELWSFELVSDFELRISDFKGRSPLASVMHHQGRRATKTSEVSMDARKSDLEQKVLRLSVTQRARLARVLLESLDDEIEEDVQAAI